jgi:tetratricopeptide (TPR) repeat protein
MASRHVLIAELLERVRRIRKTKNGLALAFWGEPGIGKSHAATQLIQGLAGISLRIQARATIRDFLDALPVATRSLPTWALRALEMAQQGQVIESRNLIAALEAKLAALAPFTLHLENWHEATTEQHEFWTQLVLVLQHTRQVLVLVTSRTQPPLPFESHQLERLCELEADLLFETEIAGSLPTQAKTWVFQKAQGNPLFTLEFFRYLTRQGNLWNDGTQWRWRKPSESAVPHSVEAVIEHILEDAYCLPDAKIVLGTLALIEPKDIKQWVNFCNITLETLNFVCPNLERLGVLRGLEFSHPLYRELVLRDMPQTMSCDLAQTALNMPDVNPAQLEMYLDMASLEPAVVLTILERGWLAAEQLSDDRTVARLKARASKLLQGESRRSLALEAVRIFVKNDTPAAIEFLEWLMGVFPDDSEIVEPLARIYAGRTQSEKGLRLLESLSEREHSPQRWRRRLFEFLLNANQYEQAFIMFDSDAHLLKDASVLTLAHTAFAFIYQGRFEEANTLLQQIQLKDLELAEKYTVLTTQGTYAFLRGDLISAFKIYSDALTVAEALSTENKIIYALHNRSVIASALYRFREAANDLERCLKRLENIGDVWVSARHLALLGSSLVESGDFVRAEDLLLESRAIYERGQPSSIDWMMLECTLAELYCVWDTPHADVLAMKHARGALFHANNLGRPSMQIRPLTTASQVEGFFGSPERALDYAIQALDLVEKYDQEFAQGYALETFGLALSVNGRFDEAKETLQQASVLFRDSGALLIKAEAVLIEVDRLNHDTASAQSKLELFKQAGYGSGIAQIKRAFPKLEPAKPNLGVRLNLRLLGPLTIELNGKPLRLQGAKRKALIALLAEANAVGRSGKQRLQLLDALYPSQSETDAVTALHQLVYSCRASLGENSIETLDEGYGLRGANLDVTQFLETGDTTLWRGPYVADVELDADSTLLEALTEKLHQRSEELLASDPKEAIRLAKILLEMNTYDVRALKVVACALQVTKQYTALTRFYAKVRTEFLEVGEFLPERWTDFLELRTQNEDRTQNRLSISS